MLKLEPDSPESPINDCAVPRTGKRRMPRAAAAVSSRLSCRPTEARVLRFGFGGGRFANIAFRPLLYTGIGALRNSHRRHERIGLQVYRPS